MMQERGRGRPPKNPTSNLIPAACVWEALRHNETFCNDVEIIWSGYWDPETREINDRLHKRIFAKMLRGCAGDYARRGHLAVCL